MPALCRAALMGAAPRLAGDGKQIRDLVYVDNVVAALLAAAGATNSVRSLRDGAWLYNIASGEPVSLLTLWAAIAQEAGSAVAEPEFFPAPAHEPPNLRVSIARARRDLGYRPEVALREGLRRTVVSYRKQLTATGNDWFAPCTKVTVRPPPPPPSGAPRRGAPQRGVPQGGEPQRGVIEEAVEIADEDMLVADEAAPAVGS